jgi:hypothetical protein
LLERAPRGLTEATLLRVHGFTSELIIGLVHDGLAYAGTETAIRGSRTIQVSRVKITEAGQDALAAED